MVVVYDCCLRLLFMTVANGWCMTVVYDWMVVPMVVLMFVDQCGWLFMCVALLAAVNGRCS